MSEPSGSAPAPAATSEPALPVARVLVDLPLAHLDRPFDYRVTAEQADDAQPGARVRVHFAGQDVAGFVLERAAASEHPGRLAPLRRVVSPEPVLAPEVAALTEVLSRRYAGTRSDLLRLAIPPRHARVEKEPPPPAPAPRSDDERATLLCSALEGWDGVPTGQSFARALAQGAAPRAVWSASPGDEWPRRLAQAAALVDARGQGAVLCVPDRRDLARLDEALGAALGEGRHVLLHADAGPARRYRAFLTASRGGVRVVAGTRAAAFSPVHDLGLVVVWDDGDDLLAEPRAPYPHAREVLLERARAAGAAVLVAGYARTVEAQYLLRTGWAVPLTAERATLRERVQVDVAGASDAELERDPFARSTRLPHSAVTTVRRALEHGPVLVQTPRAGYAVGLACDRCRTPARCTTCSGPLQLRGRTSPPSCRWCGRGHPAWTCVTCGGHGLRAPVLGDQRTAEELGRTFSPVPVRTSSGERVLERVGAEPSLVVATPGAEPVAEGGYAAVVLLDAWLMLARPDLRTAEEALRRWMNAAAMVRPPGEGGRVVVVGDSREPSIQALVRWDPAGFAERETAERAAAHLPPASRVATLTGPDVDVEAFADEVALPGAAEVLGPVPAGEDAVRLVLRVPRAAGPALASALRETAAVRSARKAPAVRVQVDPVSLG